MTIQAYREWQALIKQKKEDFGLDKRYYCNYFARYRTGGSHHLIKQTLKKPLKLKRRLTGQQRASMFDGWHYPHLV